MRPPRFALALLIALAPGAFATPVFAQAGAEDPITSMARARFKEGVDFYDKGQYEQARAAFLQAYALKKHPAVLLNLAWSSLKSGHTLEGKKYFEQFLSEAKDATDKQRADAKDGLTQANAKLGHIEIQAPAGTDVTVDSDHAGTAPIAEGVYVEPGAHTVKFKSSDGTTDTESVSVLAGQKAVAKFGAAGGGGGAVAGAAPPPTTASNTPAPSEPAAAPPSPPEQSTATLAPGPKETVGGEAHASLFAPPKNVVPAVVLASIGVAGFVTAGIMYFVKQSAVNNQESVARQITGAYGGNPGPNFCDNPPTDFGMNHLNFASICQSYNSDVSDVNADATVANVAIGVGVAGIVGAAIYWLVASKHQPGSTALITTPVVTPQMRRGGGSLSLSAEF